MRVEIRSLKSFSVVAWYKESSHWTPRFAYGATARAQRGTNTLSSPRDHPQRIQSDDVQRNPEAVSEAGRTKTIRTSEDRLNQGTVDYEFYNAGGITAELHGRTAKTANIGISIRQIPSSTIVFNLENSIHKSSDYLFWFSIGCDVVDQGSGDGWFFGRVEILAISLWKEFSKPRDAGREDCVCSEQEHP